MDVRNELDEIERNTPAWTLDAYGCHIQRDLFVDSLGFDVVAVRDPFAELIATIEGDDRKTFSKSKILELINEYRP